MEEKLVRKSPHRQLWEMTNDSQHEGLSKILKRVKKKDQEVLVYGLIAYLKYKIRRPFECVFMNLLMRLLIEVVEKNAKNHVKSINN